jgi:hypothetical protein
MLLSFVRGYIKEVRTVQEQEGSTEDICIHRRNFRGGYTTENTNTKHTVQVETWYYISFCQTSGQTCKTCSPIQVDDCMPAVTIYKIYLEHLIKVSYTCTGINKHIQERKKMMAILLNY